MSNLSQGEITASREQCPNCRGTGLVPKRVAAQASKRVNTVPRFSNWCLVSHGHDMLAKADGNWVRFKDYEHLARALKQSSHVGLMLTLWVKNWQRHVPENAVEELLQIAVAAESPAETSGNSDG